MPDPRPKRYPPPEFPARRPALFARTPPAIFPVLLGLLGLALSLRLASGVLGVSLALADLLAGVALALWAFGALAYAVKVLRRPGVVIEDLRVLPGRTGLAALTIGGMAAATLLSSYTVAGAMVLLVLALIGHAVLAGLLIRLLVSLPPPGCEVNPSWHLSFVGFIVAAPGAVALGWSGLAEVLFWACLPLAVTIWALSAVQFWRVVPPAVLRPLLAIHLAPAALLSTVAALLGKAEIASGFLLLATGYGLALILSGRWLVAAGISPLWGAFTFPLAVLASAMLRSDWLWPGVGLTAVALGVIPVILWWVLKRWPEGKLAAVTNAAEA